MATKFYRNEDNSSLRLRNITSLSNTAIVLEVSPHKVHNLEVDNQHSSYIHVKLFNKAAPTLGTDVPAYNFSVKNATKRTFQFRNGSKRAHQAAMSIIATATEDSEDTQAVPGGTVNVNITTEAD